MRAENIFLGTCEHYARHLGTHQAEAFTNLWTIHDTDDPLMNSDRAARHINIQMQTDEGVVIPPKEVMAELHQGLRQVESGYPAESTARDVSYAPIAPP